MGFQLRPPFVQPCQSPAEIRRRAAPPSEISCPKSGPTNVCAICGTTSPTQPIIPAVATLADVTNVAAAMTAIRIGPVGRPQARASSSGNDSTFMRQRSASKIKMPSATGLNSGIRSAALAAARLPSSQNVMAGSWL